MAVARKTSTGKRTTNARRNIFTVETQAKLLAAVSRKMSDGGRACSLAGVFTGHFYREIAACGKL